MVAARGFWLRKWEVLAEVYRYSATRGINSRPLMCGTVSRLKIMYTWNLVRVEWVLSVLTPHTQVVLT